MKKIYIARKYITIEGGARHYYEEEIFDTYDIAIKFIKSISCEDDDSFLSEIVVQPFNSFDSDGSREVHTFDRKGELLLKYDSDNAKKNLYVVEEDDDRIVYPVYDPESYKGIFELGDLIFIKAYPWNVFSPTHIDTLGVVSYTPVSYNEWIKSGNEFFTWDNKYVILCIRDGYLGHWHVEEKGFKKFSSELPDNLAFLNILADHYSGKQKLSSQTLEEALNGKLFVEKVKHFW